MTEINSTTNEEILTQDAAETTRLQDTPPQQEPSTSEIEKFYRTVNVPNSRAEDKDVEEFLANMRPRKAEHYKFQNVADKYDTSNEEVELFRKAAYAGGLNKHQAKKMFGSLMEERTSIAEKLLDTHNEEFAEQLDDEFGDDKYRVEKALSKFTEENKLGYLPNNIRMAIGKKLLSDIKSNNKSFSAPKGGTQALSTAEQDNKLFLENPELYLQKKLKEVNNG
jgi:hypothetical protein